MPFVDIEDDKPVEKPSLAIQQEPFKGPVVDTKATDYNSLSTFYSGQKWAVDVYKKVTGRDSTSSTFSRDIPSAYGQLVLIRGFELVVDQAITNKQQVGSGNGFDSSGAGVVYPCYVPNDGDFFIADFGNGRNVKFDFYNPEKMGVYDESPHHVEWKASEFVTQELFSELEQCVGETLYFSRENMRNNLKPLLQKQEVDNLRRLNNAWRRLLGLYFKDFFDRSFSTFLVPTQSPDIPTYDPAITKYLRRTLSVNDHPSVSKIIELDVSANPIHDQLSIFDLLAKRDWQLLYSCSFHFGWESVDCYRSVPKMHSIYFSGIRRVMAAKDLSFSVNHPQGFTGASQALQKAGPERADMRGILPQLSKGGVEPAPTYGRYIKRVLVDDYYVFSKEFYEEDGEVSMLERMVQQRMQGESIDLNDLADLAEYAPRFDNLERFYYIPIILTLIKLAPGVL